MEPYSAGCPDMDKEEIAFFSVFTDKSTYRGTLKIQFLNFCIM